MATNTAIFWFRRDLRVTDHPSLVTACERSERTVPLFVWDDGLLAPAGPPRLTFLAGSVDSLSRALGGCLVQRRGDPVRVVPAVAAEAGAATVYCTADFGPYGRQRDAAVARALADQGRTLAILDSPYAVAPGTLTTSSGHPFQVFTPFSRAWRGHGWEAPLPAPALDLVDRGGMANSTAPRAPCGSARLPEPGEAAAWGRLDSFLASAASYAERRDRLDLDGTSRLSPYLRFGTLHPRQILARLSDADPGHRRVQTELCWRDFYADVLYHRPDSARHPYRPEWASFEWDEGPDADERFQAWAEGRTGYPVVDAAMRQLLGEAWVHNRARMIAASFLVKDLHLDWRRGARWFMRHLVDGDLASNQHGWQWVGGSGTDAAPYFRVFNPVAQGQRFDPDGTYVRRWVPELRHIASGAVHEPWAAAPCDYPAPIVDHALERQEALARYGRLRSARPAASRG